MTALATLLALALPQADGADGLKKLNEDILAAVKAEDKEKSAALIKGLLLPDSAAWFGKTFGEEAGPRLEAEYQKLVKVFDSAMLDFYARRGPAEQTEVQVVRHEKPGPGATGLQNQAIEAMKAPAVLYTVRFTKPGEKLGVSLWSFVQVDGAFRFAGKLRDLKPPSK
jgi:hypothetical protein